MAVTGNEITISAPWYKYHRELKAFFEYDDDVSVGDLEEGAYGSYSTRVTVKNYKKALALSKILTRKKDFGGVLVTVEVYAEGQECGKEIIQDAFDGNLLAHGVAVKAIPGGNAIFAVMNPEIIQFFNDDISDYEGNATMLAQDVARDIFNLFPYGGQACTVNIKENREGV